MGHAVESMSYAVDAQGRGVPWHGLGKSKPGGMSVSEALAMTPEIAANVDAWTIEAVSPDGSRRIVIDASQPIGAYVANVREAVVTSEGVRPEVVLGVVTDSYELAQTRDQFRAVEQIVGESGLIVETAISLFSGRVNTLLLRKPESVQMAGDEVVPYLLVVNSFDGSRALTFATTPIRVVCANTLAMADASRRTRSFALRHTGDLASKLDEARRAIGLSDSYIDSLAKRAEQLARTKLGQGDLKRLLVATFPMPERRQNEDAPVFKRRELRTRETQLRVRELLKSADNLHEHRDNAWGFVNAVIEWNDHELLGLKPGKSDDVTRTRAERRMSKIALSDSEHVARANSAVDELLVVA
jgi:phage/plasmid-like protein (TIGR03299 family)